MSKENKKIVSATMSDTFLRLQLESGRTIDICDYKQECCEERWMHTDDDPQSLVGGEYIGVEGRDATPSEVLKVEHTGDPDDTTEITFVEVKTSKGFITLCCYNQHNGYYGGFNIIERET